MQLHHVVITRFSYRFSDRPRTAGERRVDPLNPANLDHRLRLLEITSAPSLRGQNRQEFSWVVIVDQLLDPERRARLRSIVESRPNSHVHTFDPAERVSGVDWLRPYVAAVEPGDYVITTNLDDDDALPANFISAVQSEVRRVAHSEAPLILLGSSQAREWDLVLTPDAPFGTVAPWHRWAPDERRFAASGFSLAAQQPAYPFSIMFKNHTLAAEYLDTTVPASRPAVREHRERFRRAAEAVGERLEAWQPHEVVRDLSPTTGPILASNHLQNWQLDRLFEPKPGAAIVDGPDTFAGFQLGWDALELHRRDFQPGLRYRARVRTWRIGRQLRQHYIRLLNTARRHLPAVRRRR